MLGFLCVTEFLLLAWITVCLCLPTSSNIDPFALLDRHVDARTAPGGSPPDGFFVEHDVVSEDTWKILHRWLEHDKSIPWEHWWSK
jgi:hypothetical protein